MPASTVSIHFVISAIENLRCQPDVVNALLVKNHIHPNLLEDRRSRIPLYDFANLIRDVMFEIGDEQMGHGMAAQPIGSWATMAQLCVSADTLGEALRRLTRFYRLIPWGIKTHINREGDTCRFIMTPIDGHSFAPYLFESFLFYVYRFSNWLIKKQITLKQIEFCFTDTTQRSEYPRIFFTNNFQFNASVSQFSFASKYLDEPIRQDIHGLVKLLKHTTLELIYQNYKKDSLSQKVHDKLQETLNENPSIDDISKALNTKTHTLRRRLNIEGTKFKEIKDQLRFELAYQWLRQRSCSIEHISIQLGFSETSAFSRAFKNQHGVSPNTYRSHLLKDNT